MSAQTTIPIDAREVLAERLVDSLLAGLEVLTIHVGLETGLYSALAQAPATPAEVTARTGSTPATSPNGSSRRRQPSCSTAAAGVQSAGAPE